VKSRLANGQRRLGCIGTPSRSTGTAAGRNRKFPRAAFLRRSELAGHPRDAAAWQTLEPLRTQGLIENRAALRERVAELLAQVRLASADGGSTAETG